MKKQLYLSVIISLLFSSVQAQLWVEKMRDPNVNFYDVQQEFNSYWANRPYEKGKGYKQFKRWEYLMEQRCYPTGDKKLAAQTFDNFSAWENANAAMHIIPPDRKSTRLNSSHIPLSRMPSSA